jgi:hypothetical protein
MFERYQRLLLQKNAYIANQARINSTLTETAEEKFIKGKPIPELYNVPQHMLASYLDLLLKPLVEFSCVERNK